MNTHSFLQARKIKARKKSWHLPSCTQFSVKHSSDRSSSMRSSLKHITSISAATITHTSVSAASGSYCSGWFLFQAVHGQSLAIVCDERVCCRQELGEEPGAGMRYQTPKKHRKKHESLSSIITPPGLTAAVQAMRPLSWIPITVASVHQPCSDDAGKF